MPAANQVAQADITPAQFARAMGRPWGPPTLAWCLVSWLWRVSCVAAKQGWASEWVQRQMEGWLKSWAMVAAGREEGVLRPREVEEGQSGDKEEAAAVSGGTGEAASLPVTRGGTQQEAPWRRCDGGPPGAPLLLADDSAPPVPAARIDGAEPVGVNHGVASAPAGGVCAGGEGAKQIGGGNNGPGPGSTRSRCSVSGGAGAGCGADSAEGASGGAGVQGGERGTRGGSCSGGGADGRAGSGSPAGLGIAGGSVVPGGGFCEHRLLLDGASAAHALLREGVGWMPFNLPAELDIGLAQLDILLAGHWRRNTIAPSLWLDVAVDTGEGLPVREDHLVALATQMETAMLVTGPLVESREGGDEGRD
ncbi:hypothetical protein C0993_009205 [Termitomyces sp. T159_Od127]|nr:hypothetical protein C0993_009205 [Termitomyces sp. T159_Od127]